MNNAIDSAGVAAAMLGAFIQETFELYVKVFIWNA